MGVGGTKETSNPTFCSAFRGLPHWGERAGKKRGKERKGGRGRPRGDQGMKTTFLHLQTFSLSKKALFNYIKSLASTLSSG